MKTLQEIIKTKYLLIEKIGSDYGNSFDGEPLMPLEYFDSKPTIKFLARRQG